MKREIKFRGKRVDNNEWVFGYYVLDPQGNAKIYWQPFIDASSNTYHIVYPESVGQYTGLKDKNGKEIYEGGVIKVRDPYNDNWSTNGTEVIFSNEYVGGWVISNGKQNLNLGTRQSNIEVIGNIYENPELLTPSK